MRHQCRQIDVTRCKQVKLLQTRDGFRLDDRIRVILHDRAANKARQTSRCHRCACVAWKTNCLTKRSRQGAPLIRCNVIIISSIGTCFHLIYGQLISAFKPSVRGSRLSFSILIFNSSLTLRLPDSCLFLC